MSSDEWIETLEDGTNVNFMYHELRMGGVSIAAQIEGNKIVIRSYCLTQEPRSVVEKLKAISRAIY
jgi:hypothetical protein